jgi:hypothetical protein
VVTDAESTKSITAHTVPMLVADAQLSIGR